ncbi:HlyC/CorC family transporter [Paracoccus sp. SCSIO 75233]|uniref:HlyC/CorC family transporter n=1 Tax=Paracoccus sp. SCSIO 75233 TaxID=3017782 RepID=UPI0022F0AE0A|nr:HlyC/CorC family transporter [Paracoccus sp. SCSIO 75233]WBU54771.1 HlyC/CorC family transporter [Paracoccus sp. SCSIO 75233]
MIWGFGIAILFLLVGSAFFSASETALTGASRAKLRSRADKGDQGAEAALDITRESDRLIGAILLGNNVLNILSASLATAMFTALFGSSGVAIATFVMTVLVLIFAEVLPKSYAIANSETLASVVARPMQLIMKLLSPIVLVVRAIVRLIMRLFGLQSDPDANMFSVHEEIAGALSIGHEAGEVEKADRDRLLGALDLGNRTVDEIMKHRSEIQMIDADLPPETILDTVLSSSHTRLPVYRNERENVVGVVHAKDVLRAVHKSAYDGIGDPADAVRDFDVMGVAMKPYFVPDTTALDEQMREFLDRRSHFALVVDEYGSLRGLITLEDIIEEIVGEIADEHDTEADHDLKPGPSGDYLIDGAMTIRDLNRALDWTLPDDEANTVAGLVIHMAQSIPSQGQVFSFLGYRFEVVTRKDNRITKLRIRPLPGPAIPS